MGLKAVALYRDGCKASQPLSTGGDEQEEKTRASHGDRPAATLCSSPVPQSVPEAHQQLTLPHGAEHAHLRRARTPSEEAPRASRRRRVSAGTRSSCAPGEYEDGTLGEIFIDMHKEGAAFRR